MATSGNHWPDNRRAGDLYNSLCRRLDDSEAQSLASKDRPNFWKDDPRSLFRYSIVESWGFGTGHGIFKSMIAPVMRTAEREIVLVTCFWARSETLGEIQEALRSLSETESKRHHVMRVRICFSSSSIRQKLFHTSDPRGRNYSESAGWKLVGLDKLKGVDLRVKSIFVRPLSVMHTKFVMIDRNRVFLPSCNVSHEDWLEVCVHLTGPITKRFVDFWQDFWADSGDHVDDLSIGCRIPTRLEKKPDTAYLLACESKQIKTWMGFLPSPHHFDFRTSCCAKKAPQTPLNMCLLELFDNAKTSIFIQTPNVTSKPVMDGIRSALLRGVHVRIITNDKLMTNEQLVTARTTTPKCVKRLAKHHRRMLQSVSNDPEQKLYGTLHISYYRSTDQSRRRSQEAGVVDPVKSHMKVTIVDGAIVVLGSGNMDRASWFTSQELGLMVDSSQLADEMRSKIEDGIMRNRFVDFYHGQLA